MNTWANGRERERERERVGEIRPIQEIQDQEIFKNIFVSTSCIWLKPRKNTVAFYLKVFMSVNFVFFRASILLFSKKSSRYDLNSSAVLKWCFYFQIIFLWYFFEPPESTPSLYVYFCQMYFWKEHLIIVAKYRKGIKKEETS